MMTTSTCPDATCAYKNTFGYCTISRCVHSVESTTTNNNVSVCCDLCKYDLEDGDYLYQRSSQDHAMVFEEVIVHYCPVCGRKLKRN